MDEIKHFGIPGMKWGKRKVRSASEIARSNKNQARLEEKSSKKIKQLEGDKEGEQEMIKQFHSAKLSKLKKQYQELEDNKKGEQDLIKEDYNEKISKAKAEGKSSKDLETKMQKELSDNDKYWNDQIAEKVNATGKQAVKMVKELAENKAYWDQQIDLASPSKIQKEEMKYGLSIAAGALLLIGSVAVNSIVINKLK